MPDTPVSPIPTDDLPPTRAMPASSGSLPYTGDTAAAERSFGAPLAAGDIGTLGRYRVLKRLGKGGMGAVYLGQDDRLKRQVALKVMLPQLAADPKARTRFLREARSACHLDHENLVKLYDVDERNGVLFIVMQLLKGWTLDEDLKRRGAPSVDRVLRIGRETAAALAAAHRIGLVHRDIKPSNIWIEDPSGRVKVLDFGLVKSADLDEDGATELTRTGAVVGTPSYMSPEQGRGLPIDHRSDLFSLGSVLYRLCTGRLPFQGRNSMAILTALAVDDPPAVASLNPSIPPPLAHLVHALLAKSPVARPQSADEVLAALRTIESSRVEPAETVRDATPYVPDHSNDFALLDSSPGQSPSPKSRDGIVEPTWSRRWVAIGSALAGIVAIGIALAIWLRPEPPPDTKTQAVVPADAKPKPAPPKPTIPPSKFPPLGAEFGRGFRNLTPEEQVRRVVADLVRRNPLYDGKNWKFKAYPNGTAVETFEIQTAHLADLTPIQALTELESLVVGVNGPGENSSLEDLTPLVGLKNLAKLGLNGHGPTLDLAPLRKLPLRQLWLTHSRIADISALRGLPLTDLAVYLTDVTDLSPLKGSTTLASLSIGINLTEDVADLSPLEGIPLETLIVHRNRILDLSPLRKSRLQNFQWTNSPVPNLEPLKDLPITEINLDEPERHAAFLRSKGIARIGRPELDYKVRMLPADAFWAERAAKEKAEAEFVAATTRKPVSERIEAVRAELKRLNGKAIKLEPTVADGRVVAVTVADFPFAGDLSPIQAFTELKELTLGIGDSFVLLAPLAKLPIERVDFGGNGRITWVNHPALRDMAKLRTIEGQPAREVLDALVKPARK